MINVVRARWVLPIEPWQVVHDGAVAFDDDGILAVGPAQDVLADYPEATVETFDNHALMPGMVNAHTHAAMTLLRGYGDDLPLMSWLNDRIWPTESRWVDPGFVADGTRLAAAEMLAGGVTCFSDMYFFPQAAIEVAQRYGIRIMSGQVVVDGRTTYARDAAEHIEKGLAVIETHKNTPRVHFALAPHAPYTVSDDVFGQLVELCERLDVPMHTHVHETQAEVEQGLDEYGVRPLARLDRLGVVGPRLIAAHAVHLTDDEIALLGRRGAALVHCPVSNLKLASGIARLTQWLGAGIRAGLGTDGAASNNRLDVFGDMRVAAMLAKGTSGDAAAVAAPVALHLATMGSAAAMGLDQQIGSLSRGKSVDMIAVDLSGFELAPIYDVGSHLVNSAGRENVTDVWVDGNRCKRDGELTRDDPSELVALARTWQQRIG
jgi:5-methylthioadenosine/S-adenosylhomocysteine deaminase